MTAQLRLMLFLLMFGIFLSNNIMVPVHELSHINEGHDDSSLVSCDVYHVIANAAMSSHGYVAYVPSHSRSVDSQRYSQFVASSENLAQPIRAPPLLA